MTKSETIKNYVCCPRQCLLIALLFLLSCFYYIIEHFANDMAIYKTVNNHSDSNTHQLDFNIVQSWKCLSVEYGF